MNAYGEMVMSQDPDTTQHNVKGDDKSEFPVKSDAHRGFPVKSDAHLGLLQTQALNVDKLLSLFHGNRENVEYFIRLWDSVKNFRDEECTNFPCDPRDERKQNYVKDWRPAVRVCPAHLGTWDFEADVVEPEGTLAAKQVVLDKEEGQHSGNDTSETIMSCDGDKKSFHCGVHGCGQVLSSLASYESHYRHCHNYVCATCRRVFVSDFLLGIHLEENHDSYFAILSPRLDMYRCLVESCEQKFRTPELRKDHVVSCHKFPPSFSFHQPVKENRSRLTQSSSGKGPSSMETSPLTALTESDNTAMDTDGSIVSTASNRKNKNKGQSQRRNENSQRGKRVPSTICFGRGSQRAFQQRTGRGGKGRNWYQTNASMETDTTVDIEAVDMQDLAKALT